MCRTFTEPIYFIILGWILYVSQMESESQLSAQGPLCSVLKHANQQDKGHQIGVRSQRCSCLVTWFCYQLIAKPGNKTAAVSWPDPYTHHHCRVCCHEIIVTVNGSNYKLKRLFFCFFAQKYSLLFLNPIHYQVSPVMSNVQHYKSFHPTAAEGTEYG